MDPLSFSIWRKALHQHTLFFDGASKGNPGATGGGGVLLSPDETTEFTLSWGIGDDTNNIVEALALWQGLYQVLAMKVKEVIVFGDSRVIIQALNIHALPHNMRLRHLIRKIMNLLPAFHKIKFFHILRELNGEADKAANAATRLSKGTLCINGNTQSFNIP
jgi:ribonuclease HI